ncbi:MAG: hypothetical protein ACRDSK_00930 [Actinophytocola sp.]|uniref:hypothetical protein n=1 Tax=Actinophytocola sp. TaxID=1872138 RepID=UPI003D6A4031
MTTQGTPPAISHAVYGNGKRHAAPPDALRDDTTRYLCAAAHLDKDFANDAIREFLVESTRPIPPSAGVDAAAVLGEAVAARTRRKLRDLAVIALLIGLLFFVSVELLAMWLVVAAVLSVPAMAGAVRKGGLSAKPALYVAGGVGIVVLFVILWPEIENMLSGLGTSSDYYYEPVATRNEVIADIVLTGLGVAALLAVFLADRLVVWRHLNERFWPNRRTAPLARIHNRNIYQYSPTLFVTQLRRYVDSRATIAAPPPHEFSMPTHAEPAPLLVYRDYVPFVGAGMPEKPWSIAVPLERLPGTRPTAELTTDTLYAAIRKEIESLRDAVTLAPGRRLGDLGIGEMVIVSADELIDHLEEPSAADFLDQPGVAPFNLLRPGRVQSIKVEPVEWARYYQCYEVETWDRDLVLSVFVHVAVGQDALYVEWTPCVLLPIKKEYREIDTMSRSLWRPLLGAVADLLRLPASIPGRLAHTFTFIRAARQHLGVVSSTSYGVSASLRELASAPIEDNYFQFADIDRYQKMMKGRLILAVSRMMRAAGFSPASFDAQAATVVNNNVNIGGNVGGNFVAGSHNNVGERAATADGGRS